MSKLTSTSLAALSWGSFNSPTFRNTGGVFTNNLFKSGATGYFGASFSSSRGPTKLTSVYEGYGVSVAAQLVAQVSGNRFLNANFGGIISASRLPFASSPVLITFLPSFSSSVYRTTLRSPYTWTAVPGSPHDDRNDVPERFPYGQHCLPDLLGTFGDPAGWVHDLIACTDWIW